jgi:hypothetical protein
MGKTASETFQLIKQAYSDNALPYTVFYIQYFWMVVEILKVTNTVGDKQPHSN